MQRQGHRVPEVQAELGERGLQKLDNHNESDAFIIVVKLLRTDTTLDLSQKARVVRSPESPPASVMYTPETCARTVFIF